MKDIRPTIQSLTMISRRVYLTFVICTTISFGLILSNDNSQVDRMRAVLLEGWATVLRPLSWVESMSQMRKEMSSLRERSTRLYLENAHLREAALENERLHAMLALKERSQYKLRGARVLSRNRDNPVASLTIDVGRAQGVKKNLPVITPMGLAGKVLSVGENTSLVELATDYNFRAACQLQRSRVDGILAYEPGGGYALTQVPKNSDARVGDVVITSGYSSIFPRGLQVGIVTEVDRDNPTLFLKIRVRPTVDFSRIEELFVIYPADNENPN